MTQSRFSSGYVRWRCGWIFDDPYQAAILQAAKDSQVFDWRSLADVGRAPNGNDTTAQRLPSATNGTWMFPHGF